MKNQIVLGITRGELKENTKLYGGGPEMNIFRVFVNEAAV
jgi:hypothetical protein